MEEAFIFGKVKNVSFLFYFYESLLPRLFPNPFHILQIYLQRVYCFWISLVCIYSLLVHGMFLSLYFRFSFKKIDLALRKLWIYEMSNNERTSCSGIFKLKKNKLKLVLKFYFKTRYIFCCSEFDPIMVCTAVAQKVLQGFQS